MMLSSLKVPGVYVQEVSLLPPSVAAVATSVPAFLGYTERQPEGTAGFPVRVESMLEFTSLFGGPPTIQFDGVTLNARGEVSTTVASLPYYLYQSLRLFYANGGGRCYVSSVGTYTDDNELAGVAFLPTDGNAIHPLDEIGKVDEITLLLAPDAVRLPTADLQNLHQTLLTQCGTLMDRFAILDVNQNRDGNDNLNGKVDLTTFRTGVGQQYLSYGAAYAPMLRVVPPGTVNYLSHGALKITGGGGASLRAHVNQLIIDGNGLVVNPYAGWNLLTDAHEAYVSDMTDDPDIKQALVDSLTAFTAANGITLPTTDDGSPAASLKVYSDAIASDAGLDALNTARADVLTRLPVFAAYERGLRAALPAYGALAAYLEALAFDLPPSGAVAGVFARTDANRGVWKAPANVSINGIVGVSERYTSSALAGMNVHPGTGKSVNAIRALTGHGILIYGARTLAGNDGEYRYVSVRRLLNFLEESIKKASQDFIFEANDVNTWTRMRGMIENFLNLQWRAGALQGATPAEAYRVRIGLGTTMTADDVTNGRMIVSISVAPVRPAEFIVLRFIQHQLK
ncbi:phage tail sheath family protein [Neolewinella antarctica]|uniref:Uncharacterized protein n=1 Tax=Neolewinella antarctica TaxID=442734 RepID=A0ABX0X6M9_9BACT|nr:phage tail sheath C-terminal domain-containing protein [Neolewinella antarctica]NJC24673.1 hypothetical protein [Neolewinella antarctica]